MKVSTKKGLSGKPQASSLVHENLKLTGNGLAACSLWLEAIDRILPGVKSSIGY